MKQKWISDTLQPFGHDDATLQITVLRDDRETGLFTWRGGKDTDMTAAQFQAIGEACLMAARRLGGEALAPTDDSARMESARIRRELLEWLKGEGKSAGLARWREFVDRICREAETTAQERRED